MGLIIILCWIFQYTAVLVTLVCSVLFLVGQARESKRLQTVGAVGLSICSTGYILFLYFYWR